MIENAHLLPLIKISTRSDESITLMKIDYRFRNSGSLDIGLYGSLMYEIYAKRMFAVPFTVSDVRWDKDNLAIDISGWDRSKRSGTVRLDSIRFDGIRHGEIAFSSFVRGYGYIAILHQGTKPVRHEIDVQDLAKLSYLKETDHFVSFTDLKSLTWIDVKVPSSEEIDQFYSLQEKEGFVYV